MYIKLVFKKMYTLSIYSYFKISNTTTKTQFSFSIYLFTFIFYLVRSPRRRNIHSCITISNIKTLTLKIHTQKQKNTKHIYLIKTILFFIIFRYKFVNIKPKTIFVRLWYNKNLICTTRTIPNKKKQTTLHILNYYK